MSVIDILFTSWPRSAARSRYLARTIDSLKTHLQTGEHKLRWTCSSESRRVDKVADRMQRKICRERGVKLIYQPGEPCLGRNMNFALNNTSGDFIFYVQDDWLLDAPLDICPGVELLQTRPKVSLVRYHWQEAKFTPRARSIAPGFVKLAGGVPYVFSHNPYLAPRRFYKQTGPFYEEKNAVNERKMNARVQELKLIVAAHVPSVFSHCGRVSTLSDRWLQRLRNKLHIPEKHFRNYDANARASGAILSELRSLLLDYRPSSVLELGPGVSSMLFLIYQQHQYWCDPFRYLAIDHQGPYHDKHRQYLESAGRDTASLAAVPLLNDLFYDTSSLRESGRLAQGETFGLVFVDGPPGSKRRGCDAAKSFLHQHTTDNSIIVLDDSHRKGEQELARWLGKKRPYRLREVADRKLKRKSLVMIPKQRKKAPPLPSS